MMLRRQNDELHPGILGKFDDCVRVPVIRVEPGREFSILRAGDMSVRLNLFTVVAGELSPLPNTSEHRVEAEVYKHTVFPALPIAHRGGTGPRDRRVGRL